MCEKGAEQKLPFYYPTTGRVKEKGSALENRKYSL
jgi:hypothetical protein